MYPKNRITLLALTLVIAGSLSACGGNEGGDQYDSEGNLKISMRNVYFESWSGGDTYLRDLEKKFDVAISPSSYSYDQWTQLVTSDINGNNLTDVFHFNVTQFNFANTYMKWIKKNIIKPLPDDLSNWPNVKSLIDNSSYINQMKIDGKLYGIPISRNKDKTDLEFASYTYLYRRDWAKEWGVYQENDEYTWEQFTNLLNVFNARLYASSRGSKFALVDVEWGFPSITNFYKTSPHCFAYKDGQYVSSFGSEEYITGLDLSKSYVSNNIYGYPQYTTTPEGGARKSYCSNNAGVLYENISLSNLQAVRTSLKTANGNNANFPLDEATAIMKVKGPDNMYSLEGAMNWFSMTLFNSDISDKKLNKILDLYDYLLSEEGTKLAVYGKKNYDYIEDEGGNISLTEDGWPIGSDGKYVKKVNGAKYLRYCLTLGNDYADIDPLTDQHAFSIFNTWQDEMVEASENNELRIFKEEAEVMWLSSALKDRYEANLLSEATASAIQYLYNKISKNTYLGNVTGGEWVTVLEEINDTLGKNL
ncbi:MAG: hypothetical protein WCX47_01965 [Bacilli bacterium]